MFLGWESNGPTPTGPTLRVYLGFRVRMGMLASLDCNSSVQELGWLVKSSEKNIPEYDPLKLRFRV